MEIITIWADGAMTACMLMSNVYKSYLKNTK